MLNVEVIDVLIYPKLSIPECVHKLNHHIVPSNMSNCSVF